LLEWTVFAAQRDPALSAGQWRGMTQPYSLMLCLLAVANNWMLIARQMRPVMGLGHLQQFLISLSHL